MQAQSEISQMPQMPQQPRQPFGMALPMVPHAGGHPADLPGQVQQPWPGLQMGQPTAGQTLSLYQSGLSQAQPFQQAAPVGLTSLVTLYMYSKIDVRPRVHHGVVERIDEVRATATIPQPYGPTASLCGEGVCPSGPSRCVAAVVRVGVLAVAGDTGAEGAMA